MDCTYVLGVVLVNDVGLHMRYVEIQSPDQLPGLGVLLYHLTSFISPFLVSPQSAKDFFSPITLCKPLVQYAGGVP